LKLSDGSFYNQHLVINITEQKKSEMNLKSLVEEKNLQLREVNHRVKNNMQMLLSLLRLQLSNNISTDAAYNLKTFEQRIKSMMLVQEDLNPNAIVSKVPFHSYAAKLADNLSKAYNINTEKIKMNIDLGELHIPAELAISCGLIINELLTNSIKHAFPDNTEGEITLKLKGDNEGFEFTVKDNGIGLPKISNKSESTGIGLQLVNTLVSQLGGEIAIHNKVGMEYRINVKTSEHKTA
jgi:two-component sensor histidine kinase